MHGGCKRVGALRPPVLPWKPVDRDVRRPDRTTDTPFVVSLLLQRVAAAAAASDTGAPEGHGGTNSASPAGLVVAPKNRSNWKQQSARLKIFFGHILENQEYHSVVVAVRAAMRVTDA